MALVIRIPRGQAVVHWKIVRQRKMPSASAFHRGKFQSVSGAFPDGSEYSASGVRAEFLLSSHDSYRWNISRVCCGLTRSV
jgi:hypothetical protein